MESMVEENGSAVDPLSTGPPNDAAPAIATSVQSIDRTHQQQTHHLVASTSIVQLTLPSSGTTQVYRRLSCVSMSDRLLSLYFGACIYHLFYPSIVIISIQLYLSTIQVSDLCIMLVVSWEIIKVSLRPPSLLDSKMRSTSCKCTCNIEHVHLEFCKSSYDKQHVHYSFLFVVNFKYICNIQE